MTPTVGRSCRKGSFRARVPRSGVFRAARSCLGPARFLYELHVRVSPRGTRHFGNFERGSFAGLAHPAAIEHLVRLGVTSVEIMPAAAWIEERHLAATRVTQLLGLQPDHVDGPRSAPCARRLGRNSRRGRGAGRGGHRDDPRCRAQPLGGGRRARTDVVATWPGQCDLLPRTAGAPWRYSDDTGCGNTLALDRPAPLRLAMDALRIWAELAGVHGFRFDLATTLGRRANGFDPRAPLLSAIEQDPLLRELKLIAEPWDVGAGGYQVGAFPAAWGEWNDRFRDGVRRFWRGDPGQLGEAGDTAGGFRRSVRGTPGERHARSTSSSRMMASRSPILFRIEQSSTRPMARTTATAPMRTFSWNNGAEGPTPIPRSSPPGRATSAPCWRRCSWRAARRCWRWVEFGQSQGGNNNAYAQDNAATWLDWATVDAGLLAWTRHLLRIAVTFRCSAMTVF